MKEKKTGSISRKWNFLLFLRDKTNESLFRIFYSPLFYEILENISSFRIVSRVRWIRKMGREDVRMKEFSSMCVWNTIQHRWPARPAPSCICVDERGMKRRGHSFARMSNEGRELGYSLGEQVVEDETFRLEVESGLCCGELAGSIAGVRPSYPTLYNGTISKWMQKEENTLAFLTLNI